jgi:hypothetical protein
VATVTTFFQSSLPWLMRSLSYRRRNTFLALAVYSRTTPTVDKETSPEALASSLHICELLVFQLLLYVTHPLDYSSTYTCFLFFTPEMKASLTRQGIAGKYTFTHPVPVSVPDILNISLALRPSSVTPPTSRSHMESRIRLPVADLFSIVMKRHSAMPTWLWLAFSFLCHRPERYLHKYRRPYMLFSLTEILFRGWPNDMAKETSRKSHGSKSMITCGVFFALDSRLLGMVTVSGTYVNIVNDVINSTAVHWAAERLVRSFS